MEDYILKHLPNLNFVEILCLYVLFDVKKALNKLSCSIDKLSEKVERIDKIELEILDIKYKLENLLKG